MTDSLDHWRTVRHTPGRHFTVVCFGDSNTEQHGGTEGRLNWVGLLAHAIFNAGKCGQYTVINSGICGDTAEGALRRLDRDVLRFRPDLVILAFGMNDWRRFPPEITAENHRELVRRIQAAGASILLRIPQPVYKEGADAWADEPAFLATVEALRSVAAEMNLACVDHFALWTAPGQPHTPAYYSRDWLHPNWNGHRRFLGEIAPVLEIPDKFDWESAS